MTVERSNALEVWRTVPCKLWTGALNKKPNGYGVKGIGNHKIRYVHRLAWEEVNGPIPKGIRVLHRCDVPQCYEIQHLFLGTAKDNSQDMLAKGRESAGEDRWNCKLTKDQVDEIRSLAGTMTQRKIAERFQVSYQQVSKIIRNERRKVR